jgi:hypothetical protein
LGFAVSPPAQGANSASSILGSRAVRLAGGSREKGQIMKRILTLALLAAGAGAGAGGAEGQAVAVSGGIGSAGVDAEVQVALGSRFQVRGSYSYLKFSHDETYDDIHYNGDLRFSNPGAFVDVRPFGNSFIVTGGAYFGKKDLALDARPTSNVQIGNATYTPAQVGVLNGKAKLNDTAPFLGIGWDTTFQGDGPWGFKVIAGAMYTGSPKVSLTATGGTLAGDPTFQQQVANERQQLQDDADNLKVYPVVQAGLTFRF